MSASTEPVVPDPTVETPAVDGLLRSAVQETARLLQADGAMVYLLDAATGTLRFAHDAGIRSDRARRWVSAIELEPGQGMFGTAVATRAVIQTSDYRSDPSFQHAADPDRVAEDIGIRSMVVAPMVHGETVFGALGAFATSSDAFSDAQIGLVRSLADHAAVAIANLRLITELDASRSELAERAEIERTLREISVRISAATDLAEVLQRAVDEAARLLHADGARIDLIDAQSGLLRWAYASGDLQPDDEVWPPDPDETIEQGVSGQAVVTGKPFWTGDYGNDDRFPHGRSATRYAKGQGIHSVMAVPLIGDAGAFGALTAFTARPAAWDDAVAPLLEAIGAQAAIAITRARLIDELDRSRAAEARRAEAEQALREIAARITALRDPDEILQQVVELASRLVRGDGAILDLLDPVTGDLRWAFDDGLSRRFTPDERAKLWISVGVGATGQAVAEDRTIIAADDLATLFPPSPEGTEFYARTGFRSMIAAPITGDDGPLGVIEVYAVQPDAFEAADGALIEALAGQAAVAITNARLIAALAASREETARRADAERTLREIAAGITAILDPTEVLERIVSEAARLLATDGAHLTRMEPSGETLVPVVVAGETDAATREWLLALRFPVGGGINGLAAAQGAAVWTFDYLDDQRLPRGEDDLDVARRLGVRGMAAAPMREPGGEVIGTLAVSTSQPRAFEADDLDLLQGLASQAAIAITNSNLLARLMNEEARFRSLVQTTPDVIWRADTEGRFTFMADSGASLFGHPIDSIIGQHFGRLTDPESMALASERYLAAGREPDGIGRVPLTLVRRDGTRFAAEVSVAGVFEDGTWVGNQGTVRDVSERDRLERDLQRSEERYRFLIQNSPDVVFSTDADGRFTFTSAAMERMTGYTPDELTGQLLHVVVDPSSMATSEERWQALVAHPDRESQAHLTLRRKDGRQTHADVRAVGVMVDGRFAGIQGAVRDISDQVRLEQELRRQAGELASGEERAHLARELHDSVTQALFSMTLVSRSVEMLMDPDPAAARVQLQQLRELQREALAEMRALIFELRPGNIEQDGLVRALKTHASALQGRIGLPILVESDLTSRLPLEAEQALYRVAQEALHNVVKHAAARQVRLDIRRDPSGVRMRIEDDGQGFDPKAVPDGHLGLAGMRARADRLGATFSCVSRPGAGTSVEVSLAADALGSIEERARLVDDASRTALSMDSPSIRDG